jgi:hypothetical protein
MLESDSTGFRGLVAECLSLARARKCSNMRDDRPGVDADDVAAHGFARCGRAITPFARFRHLLATPRRSITRSYHTAFVRRVTIT